MGGDEVIVSLRVKDKKPKGGNSKLLGQAENLLANYRIIKVKAALHTQRSFFVCSFKFILLIRRI